MNIIILEKQLTKKVQSCIDKTCYTNKQIDNMISNGKYLLGKISELNGSEYKLVNEDDVTGIIRIKNFHFNHNDMLVYIEDFFTIKALKEIFSEWISKEYLYRFYNNGYSTALVIEFNCYKKMDDFDDKLKNIKYV